MSSKRAAFDRFFFTRPAQPLRLFSAFFDTALSFTGASLRGTVFAQRPVHKIPPYACAYAFFFLGFGSGVTDSSSAVISRASGAFSISRM